MCVPILRSIGKNRTQNRYMSVVRHSGDDTSARYFDREHCTTSGAYVCIPNNSEARLITSPDNPVG